MTAETVRERVASAIQGVIRDADHASPEWSDADEQTRACRLAEADAALVSLADPVVVAGAAEVVLGVLHPHHDPDECSDEWHAAQADKVARAVVEWITGGGE